MIYKKMVARMQKKSNLAFAQNYDRYELTLTCLLYCQIEWPPQGCKRWRV